MPIRIVQQKVNMDELKMYIDVIIKKLIEPRGVLVENIKSQKLKKYINTRWRCYPNMPNKQLK